MVDTVDQVNSGGGASVHQLRDSVWGIDGDVEGAPQCVDAVAGAGP
ncbi:hypothetical protein [Rhodococcus globerulus]